MLKIKNPLASKKQSQSQSQAPSQSKAPTSAPQAEQRSGREDEIRPLAYRKWQEAGCPVGDGAKFWVAAETEILRGKGR